LTGGRQSGRVAGIRNTTNSDLTRFRFRELRPGGHPAPGERIWQHAKFTILYRIDDKTGVIEIGVLKRRP